MARRPIAGFFELISDEGRNAIHRFTWRWSRLVSLAPELTVETLLHRLLDITAQALGHGVAGLGVARAHYAACDTLPLTEDWSYFELAATVIEYVSGLNERNE